MVAPVTDLGVSIQQRTLLTNGLPLEFYSQKHKYRQHKPFTLILPYSNDLRWMNSFIYSDLSRGTLPVTAGSIPFGDINWTPVLNRSYEKLRGKIYDKVGAGVDFVEYRQSVDMIASTATTLAKAFFSVKHLRFGDAAKALRMKFIPKRVSPFKSAGNNWLEFHFGWTPLVSDIHDALNVINDPVKSFSLERSMVKENFNWFSGVIDNGASYTQKWAKGFIGCKQGARVKFFTPGISHTLDQFGISNPLSLAWEVVPFSFVVDWFVNVGGYLDSLTDFAGMTLDSTYRTLFYRISCNGMTQVKPSYSPYYETASTCTYMTVNRAATLSGLTLSVAKLKPPSVTRAATAISLLLQQMRGH